MKNFIFGILTVLIIGGIAFVAYRAGQKNYLTTNQPVVSPAVIVASPTTIASPTTELTPVKENDDELVKKALYEKHGWTGNEVTVTVSTNDGKYASGGVTAQGGGGYFFAAKVNGVWQIVADGNGVIMCDLLKNYPDFPTTLIPECWDQTTSKNVKR